MNNAQFKQQLYYPKADKFLLFAHLKFESNLNEVQKIIQQNLSHPLLKQALFANPLPKEYKEIRSMRLVRPTTNLEGEIGWNLIPIELHHESINAFLRLKSEFENSFFLCNYDKAEKILEQIESSVCKSSYTIRNSFLLKEFKYGTEANWTQLSDLSKIIHDWLLLFLTEHYSKIVEDKISYLRFKDLVANRIENIDYKALYEYLFFKLLYPSYPTYKDFSFFLSFESNSSIIDRYLILIDVLAEIILNNKEMEVPEYICNSILQLSSKIEDTRLVQLLAILKPTPYTADEASKRFLNLLNKFTQGYFTDCMTECRTLFSIFPTSFEIYEIYIKSLIELNEEYKETGISKFIDDTLFHLYNLISHNDQIALSTAELMKISAITFSCNWGKQLHNFIKQQTTSFAEEIRFTQYIINSVFINPRILSCFTTDSPKFVTTSKYLSQFIKENTAVKVNHLIRAGDYKSLESEGKISKNRRSIYILRAVFNSKNFELLNTYCDKVLKNKFLSQSILEETINYKFISCLKLGKCEEAIIFYVNNYLENKNHIQRVDTKQLLDAIAKQKSEDLSKLIEYPIFYFIVTNDPYEQFVAYDTFIESIKVERPTDPILDLTNFAVNKLVFFLRYVCTLQIMHYSLMFNSQDEIEEERLKILRLLLKMDIENEESYIKEIAELTQNANIRKAIREVNKGKITVNVQQLKNIESANIKEGFARYQELIKYSNNNKNAISIDFTPKLMENYLKTLFDEKPQKLEESKSDPAYISFKTMFLDLRDKYILSKAYGLDGYLSTRIRHGTLENYIRSIFENQHLISERDSKGNYLPLKYWDDKIPLPVESSKAKLYEILKDFSSKIDKLIQVILKEYIQVYTEKHINKSRGFFNYRFSEDYLWLSYNVVKDRLSDYNQFLDFAFEELEILTEKHLQSIRTLFNSEIKELFLENIDDLLEKVNKALDGNTFTTLTSSIMRCRTEIQDELRNISEWFRLSNPSADLMLDIDTVLKTSIEISNSIYPNHQIQPELKTDLSIKLVSSIHLIYITRILLDNIIKHSGLDSSNLKVLISAELLEQNLLRLSFSNNLSKEKNLEELVRILDEKKERWLDITNFEKINIEGGSGFDKIRRILAVDMKCNKIGFDYTLENYNITIMIDIEYVYGTDEQSNSY